MGALSPIFYAMVAFGIFQWLAPRFTADEQKWLRLSLGLHAVMAFAHVFVTIYVLGGGDMQWYHRAGSEIADLWRTNPGRWTEEVVKLTLRFTARFPFWVHGAGGGTSTGAMFGISTWLMILTGNSMYGATMILSCANFFSRLAMYAVLRKLFAGDPLRWMLFAVMFFPSAVFWTAGILKESVAMAGVGYAVYGAYLIAEKSAFMRGALLVGVGAFTSYLVKPYVLFPFALGIPVWYFFAKLRKEEGDAAVLLTPFRIVTAVGLGVLGLGVLSVLVPSLAIESISDEVATMQNKWDRVSAANAAIEISKPAASGPLGILMSAPLGLLNALTRPWLFEARNPQMLLAAVENTLILCMLGIGLKRVGLIEGVRAIWAHPFILMCLSYVVIFGTAVGISTGNIGSISRYRVPLLAFFSVIAVAIYRSRLTDPRQEEQSELRPEGNRKAGVSSARDPKTGRKVPFRAPNYSPLRGPRI